MEAAIVMDSGNRMTTWRKIRDASGMNKTSAHRTENIHGVRELAAWRDRWVLRGGSSATGYVVYGLDIQANRLVWSRQTVASSTPLNISIAPNTEAG